MILRYMLDSSFCIHLMRNPNSLVRTRLNTHVGELCISTITLHELVHGADRSRRPEYQRELVMDFTSHVEVLDFDARAADHSGNIHATLAKAGAVIGAYDMLIAGHARSLGLIMVTNNLKEFSRVEGLRCEDWL